MNTQNCLDAAMFAAAENYSLGVYESGECAEDKQTLRDEEFHLLALRREMPLRNGVNRDSPNMPEGRHNIRSSIPRQEIWPRR